MGLFQIFRDAWALSTHDSMVKQIAEFKAKGLNDVQAGAALIVQQWQLAPTEESCADDILI